MINAVFPMLNALDGWLSALPLLVRTVLWGGISGASCVLVYALLSKQAAIRFLKAETLELRKKLMDPSVDPGTVPRLLRRNLRMSFALLGRVIGPALVSAVPVLVVAAWLNTFHGFAAPGTDTAIPVEGRPPEVEFRFTPESRVRLADDKTIRVTAPHNDDHALVLNAHGKAVYAGDPFSPPAPVITKKQWWHHLFASEAGYLSTDAPIEELQFGFERQRVIRSGPAWLGGWEFWFFAGVLVMALALKIGFKLA